MRHTLRRPAARGLREDTCSAGCNDLIKHNKAQLIECAEDLIAAMGWEAVIKQPTQTTMLELMCDLTNEQQQLVNLLRDSEDGMHINQLVMETRLAYNMVSSELVMLELQDVVKSMPGGMWRLKK